MAHFIFQADFLNACMVMPGMGGGSGPVSLYGPDLAEWPSWVIDAMEIFHLEKRKVYGRLSEVDSAPLNNGRR